MISPDGLDDGFTLSKQEALPEPVLIKSYDVILCQ